MAIVFATDTDIKDLQNQIDELKKGGTSQSCNLDPIEKTAEMTQPVGVDENGQLYVAPIGGASVVGGLTTEQINALDGMFKVCAYIKGDISVEYEAFKKAFTPTESGGETDEPEIPDVPETPVDPEPDEPDTPIEPDPEAVVYNVFAGEYENTGYSGEMQQLVGSNINIYKTKIDVTNAEKVYFRSARTNMTYGGSLEQGKKLLVYASDDTLLGTIDINSTNVTTEHTYSKVEPNVGLAVLETLDDGTNIYSKNVGSISLADYPTKAYVLFSLYNSINTIHAKWSGTAQSTSPLTLEGV